MRRSKQLNKYNCTSNNILTMKHQDNLFRENVLLEMKPLFVGIKVINKRVKGWHFHQKLGKLFSTETSEMMWYNMDLFWVHYKHFKKEHFCYLYNKTKQRNNCWSIKLAKFIHKYMLGWKLKCWWNNNWTVNVIVTNWT